MNPQLTAEAAGALVEHTIATLMAEREIPKNPDEAATYRDEARRLAARVIGGATDRFAAGTPGLRDRLLKAGDDPWAYMDIAAETVVGDPAGRERFHRALDEAAAEALSGDGPRPLSQKQHVALINDKPNLN